MPGEKMQVVLSRQKFIVGKLYVCLLVKPGNYHLSNKICSVCDIIRVNVNLLCGFYNYLDIWCPYYILYCFCQYGTKKHYLIFIVFKCYVFKTFLFGLKDILISYIKLMACISSISWLLLLFPWILFCFYVHIANIYNF